MTYMLVYSVCYVLFFIMWSLTEGAFCQHVQLVSVICCMHTHRHNQFTSIIEVNLC